MDLNQKFQLALEIYQSGNFPEAEKICREIIESQPENIDALLLLGMLFYNYKEYDIAITYIQKILDFNSDNIYALFNLGNIYEKKGQPDTAITYFKKAITINPHFSDAYYNLALILETQGKLEEAEQYYKKTLELEPDSADACNNLGNILVKIGKANESIPYLRKALQLRPDYLSAYNNLGIAFKEQKRYDEAADCFYRVIKLNPGLADAYLNLGIVFKEKGQINDAVAFFQKAIKLKPDFADGYYNLGIVSKEKGHVNDAVAHFQKTIELNPDSADAYNNLAILSEEEGKVAEALSLFKKALKINPHDAEIHWNMSFALLKSGDLQEGWRKYDWRFLVKGFEQRYFPQPRWDGSDLEGKTLFIFAEQGIGEEIMFAACLPEVIARAELCIVECDRRLVPLFSHSFQKAKILERVRTEDTIPPEISKADMKVGIGSLPLFLRTELTSFPDHNGYLIPDTGKVSLWQDRFKNLGSGLKIGISWRGGTGTYEKLKRSTFLSQWKKLFSIQGVHFINLQYGDCATELKEAEENLGVIIHDWEDADPLKDLDNFAAQIATLDLVISIDNATVHMAGALGVPVWTLLPFAGDWRWMLNFEDTPWYPSMRLFRQSSDGNWEGIFERVELNLRKYISTCHLSRIDPDCSYKSHAQSSRIKTMKHIPSISISSRKYRCAIITPVGPGHETLYHECLASVEQSFRKNSGNFSEIVPIHIDDSEGKLGRSKARNIGVRQAASLRVEWIFFIDADDLMSPLAFEYVNPYLSEYDAIWGSIWPIERGERTPKERPYQLTFLYSIQDVLSCDPFVTLGIGHFLKTSVALSTPFNELMDAGEDFDYYLRVWGKYRCIKIPLPFFYNRRGFHSQGLKSATGIEWRQQVEKIIKKYMQEYKNQ
jgi:tetratricopeptide (TPR) repeat protein